MLSSRLQVRCQQGKDSVPRNRVYTHYAQRCGNDRVDTLNPASFGKLVRIIFPGIQTRRLGQRGESKYHYVNLVLIDEQQAAMQPEIGHGFGPLYPDTMDEYDNRSAPITHEDNIDPVLRFNIYPVITNIRRPSTSQFPADSSAFPSHDQSAEQSQFHHEGNASSQGLVYAQPSWQDDDMSFGSTGSRMYPQRLKFGSALQEALPNRSFDLPDIHNFLPPNTDPDLAHALTALYRAHSTSLIDAVRYVKEKSFFRLFATFGGTLTVPVSKIFTNTAVAPWIKLCDWNAYGEIIRVVSNLDLQVIPEPVWNMLTRVKNDLVNHITTNYSQYPDHVLQAKLEPATIFTKLLGRLLRLNETAHAAARMLLDDQQRNMMWHDWVKTVQPKRVVESELPGCGHDEVMTILTTEMRGLLEPLDERFSPELGTDFENTRQPRRIGERVPTSEDVVERWAKFVKSIPRRFSKPQTRTLIHLVNAVSTAALRDVTVAQAQSFGSWWVTKCWVDEMLLWMAEMGGFLDAGPVAMTPITNAPMSAETLDDSDRAPSRQSNGRRSAGLGIEMNTVPNFAPMQNGPTDPTGPPTATCKLEDCSDSGWTSSGYCKSED